mmetsp:Transcript_45599/g.111024  ORF Transcript_45599/g.111024 Transcript_45599/m.111024 type:complete len:565 (+) Transcript_45599:110-1804(+)
MASHSKGINNMPTKPHNNQHFDVCIVGAGPAGLAVLSAIHAPYSLDGSVHTEAQRERAIRSLHNKQKLRVCVIDIGHGWLTSWKNNFDRLGIQYLRSPALAHPDMFDPNALLTYAVMNGREDELIESGCGDIKSLEGLGQTQVGLWKLPSTSLFVDLCDDLARSSSLPHTFFGGTSVLDIYQKTGPAKMSKSSMFELTLRRDDTSEPLSEFKVTAGSVVLAVGPTGRPIIPPSIENVPKCRFWNQPLAASEDEENSTELPVLVVGGGLTAIQVALQEVERNKHRQESVILCSKRPLVSRHFDIPVDWFSTRTMNKCMAELFYDRPINKRVISLKEARGGGSIPPMYMDQIRRAEQDGSLRCVVGNLEYEGDTSNSGSTLGGTMISVKVNEGDDPDENADNDTVLYFEVNDVILACGLQPTCGTSDCNPTSLIGKVQSRWPTKCEGGLPCVTQDLRWKDGLDLFVVGALAALNGGPDAGNVMGMRRAAQLVANALDCHSWLRETALVNPFAVFGDDDSSDDDSDAGIDDKEFVAYKTFIDIDKDGLDSSTETESSSDCSCSTCSQ